MKIENLDKANQLANRRQQIIETLELSKTKLTVVVNFDKTKPLNVLNQVEVVNDERITFLVQEQLTNVENQLKGLGVEL